MSNAFLMLISAFLFSTIFLFGLSNGEHKIYKLGGILSDNESHIHFNETIMRINNDPTLGDSNSSLQEVTIIMDSNPIRTVLEVCKKLVSRAVYAVVVSHPQNGELSPAAVSYTSGFYHIPVIGISSRESAFSDKNIHVSFLRTVPPYSHQADVWVELLKTFKYSQVVFVHSSDTDGRALLGRFQNHAQSHEDDKDIKVEMVIEFEPGLNTFVNHLKEMREASARVILLYASKRDAQMVFHDAFYFNMTGEGYVWIVTEQALSAQHVPVGAIGLKLVNASNENAHITDSLYILAMALKRLRSDTNSTSPPQDCNSTGNTWETGRKLFEYIRQQILANGLTGKVAFDDHGDRINAEYEIINMQEINDSKTPRRQEVIIGQYVYNKEADAMKLSINESAIAWPGNTWLKPQGYMIPTSLKVLTIEEIPFVNTQKVKTDDECKKQQGVTCPWYNTTGHNKEMYCCTGYCIDLLVFLAKRINFTFELALSPDGQFGSYEYNRPTGKKEWTGLIGQLVNQTGGADMIVAPLTINPERAKVIEFSKPFKYQGITILEKKHPRKPALVSFLQPFRESLWILVMISVHLVALVLYAMDRLSPFGSHKMSSIDGSEEEALNLSSAVWFAWGVLLNSGIGEGTPRSFSARVLGMVWAGFAMIIVASYTANLAAFLVLDRPPMSLTGINDARLRNPMENFTYATVKGSSVDMYFRRQVELSNMYRIMEENVYTSTDSALKDVKSGKLKAFIWESSRLEFEAAQNCELVTSGDLFGRSGYGIGLRKGSPWADRVTLAILEFHESGEMEDLDNKWILNNEDEDSDKCKSDENAPDTLGLKNMAGVFILVACGIVIGTFLIIIEILYKKHQIRKKKRYEIARHAFEKWRGVIEKRKTLRGTHAFQRRYKMNEGIINDPELICYNVDQRTGALGGPSSSESMAVSSTGILLGASVNCPLPNVPPPPAPPSSLPPISLPLDIPPAPAPPRWSNDTRKRLVSDDMLPPPPPPPQGIERFGSSYINIYGPDPPDLVV